MRPTEELIKDLEDAAKYHGWQEDQGTGPGVERAKQSFLGTGRVLRRRVRYLHQRIQHLMAQKAGT